MPDKTRLSELDALRGIAALAVVGFHYTFRYEEIYHHVDPIGFSFSLGKYGVELFFAISGFVIFMTLERTRHPMDFIVSRFSRLYPAYWAAMILTTLVVHLGGLTDQQVGPRVFVENLPMIQVAVSNVQPVDGAYWTLGVELFFYCAMFALFLTKRLTRIEPILIGWIALKWLWTAHWGAHQLSWIVGVMVGQQYIPFFCIGMACYRLFTKTSSLTMVLGIIAFAIVTEFALDGTQMGIVACAVAAIFLLFVAGRANWLRWKVFVALGTISYPLYLLHENIGRTVIHALEARGIGEAVAVPVALVVALLLATAVTFLVERPTMGWIRGIYRRRAQVRAGGLLMKAAP